MIKLLLADDHTMFLEGLTSILDAEPNMLITGKAFTGDEAIKAVEEQQPDIVLLDINMPGKDGIETSKWILKNHPETKILILSMYHKTVFIEKLIGLGVHGYLLKNSGKKELLTAINSIYSGEEYFGKEVTQKLVNKLKKKQWGEVPLTEREKEVLQLISEGMTTQEISETLFISTHTVETHRKNLLSKSGTNNVVRLINWGRENEYIVEKSRT